MNLLGEIWRDVAGYDRYQVSCYGRVRAMRSTGYRVLRPGAKRRGYRMVVLHSLVGGAHKAVNLHRLVAAAFVPNPDKLPVVNHKDGDPSNNCASNLEWMTQAENMQHARARKPW